jgi:hypothetical protein
MYAIRKSVDNIKQLSAIHREKSVIIWLMAERFDCDFFQGFSAATLIRENEDIEITPLGDGKTLAVRSDGQLLLYIIGGRQIVTRERLEILSLCSRIKRGNGVYSASKLIEDILSSDGIPVLNWAPGKWFFSRGRIVSDLINKFSPSSLYIGDTTLRHELWGMPSLMSAARRKGMKVIAGSDPLPLAREEKFIGSYGFTMTGKFDPSHPAESVCALLKDPEVSVNIFGKRNSFFDFCRRQFMIMTHR